jgi:hypothetical protein
VAAFGTDHLAAEEFSPRLHSAMLEAFLVIAFLCHQITIHSGHVMHMRIRSEISQLSGKKDISWQPNLSIGKVFVRFPMDRGGCKVRERI